MTHGSLFSGRGGFDTGAGWAGIKTLYTCENDEFLRHKLKRLFPDATHYEDAMAVGRTPRVDILSAGFPCQDVSISCTGNREGIRGAARDYGAKWLGSQVKTSLLILFLRTLPSCSRKALNMSYLTFPRSGTMRSGTVGALRTSGTRITGGDSTLLPTPVASDWKCQYSSHPDILRYRNRGHQRRLIYESLAAGLKDSEILQLYSEIMSFPISNAKLKRSGNAVMPVIAEHLFKCIIQANKML